jgi:hypothetical protein
MRCHLTLPPFSNAYLLFINELKSRQKKVAVRLKIFFANQKTCVYLQPQTTINAEIAQLVEHDLAKVGVASSSLVFRSKPLKKRFFFTCFVQEKFFNSPDGGIGRHPGLKILCPLRTCGFKSRSGYRKALHLKKCRAFFIGFPIFP